jgi:hypothetical protein
MSVDGTWQVTIDTDEMDPMVAPQTATVTLRNTASDASGTMSGPYPLGKEVEVTHIKVDGDTVTWSAQMEGDGRRGQVLEFSGALGSGEIVGDVELGIFGIGTFRATKQ